MTVYCYSIGTSSGTIGVILYCILISGLRGMPGWAMGNLFLGVMMGTTFRSTKKINKPFVETIISATIIIISTAIAILRIKSVVECLLYSQPFMVRVVKNVYAFIADAFVIIVSLPLCRTLEPHIKKVKKKTV